MFLLAINFNQRITKMKQALIYRTKELQTISLERKLREAKENYEFHKSRSEWYEAAKWADIYNGLNEVERQPLFNDNSY